MPSVGFEPVIPATSCPQTYTFERSVTLFCDSNMLGWGVTSDNCVTHDKLMLHRRHSNILEKKRAQLIKKKHYQTILTGCS
jgi:hypothetical protein